MPVTAKLSRKFYETLGDELTNELVEWFNAVDLTYRSELRDLNELNFSRFDAKLEQRAVELDARSERRFVELDAKIDRVAAELRQEIAEVKSDLLKWMFIFWAGNVATTIGALAAAVAILRS